MRLNLLDSDSNFNSKCNSIIFILLKYNTISISMQAGVTDGCERSTGNLLYIVSRCLRNIFIHFFLVVDKNGQVVCMFSFKFNIYNVHNRFRQNSRPMHSCTDLSCWNTLFLLRFELIHTFLMLIFVFVVKINCAFVIVDKDS